MQEQVKETSVADNTPAEPPKKFRDMNGREKLRLVAKTMLFVISFGFAFPTLFSD